MSEYGQIERYGEVKQFKKGEILQKPGDKTGLSFYIKKGLMISYTMDDKGKEHIYMFGSEGWIMSDVEAQAFDNNSLLYIQCFEDCEAVVVDTKKFDFTTLSQEQNDVMVTSLFKRIGVLQRRVISLMSATARERYESFLEIYPDLPNRVPLKMIASYLGITPEALSAIRGKIARDQ